MFRRSWRGLLTLVLSRSRMRSYYYLVSSMFDRRIFRIIAQIEQGTQIQVKSRMLDSKGYGIVDHLHLQPLFGCRNGKRKRFIPNHYTGRKSGQQATSQNDIVHTGMPTRIMNRFLLHALPYVIQCANMTTLSIHVQGGQRQAKIPTTVRSYTNNSLMGAPP